MSKAFLFSFFVVFMLLFLESCKNVSSNKEESIALSYQCFIDQTSNYSIEQLENIPFSYVCDINFPFFSGDLWIKTTLYNPSETTKEVVLMNHDIINKRYLFYPLSDHQDKELLNQDNEDNRSFNFPNPNFKISLEPKQKLEVIVHTKSDGRSIRATPFVVSLPEFIKLVHDNTLKDIFFYGVLFVILGINIFYWYTFQSKFYAIYISYILCTTLFYLGFDSYIFQLDLPRYIAEQLVFICLKAMIFSLLLFSAHFLNIPKTNPKFYRRLLYFNGITMLLVVYYQIFFCMDAIGKIHHIEFLLGFIWLCLLLYMTISAYRKKQKETQYYIIGMTIALFFVFLGILHVSMATETTGKDYFKLGTSVEFIVFTYISAKIAYHKNQRLSALLFKQKELNNHNRKLKKLAEKVSTNRLEKSDFIGIFKLLESNISNTQEWYNFKQKIQEIHPDFYPNLWKVHPNLTKSEIRLLTLVKIGFTQKEIANVLCIAESSVKKAKQRVRKKMILDSDTTLTNYLATI